MEAHDSPPPERSTWRSGVRSAMCAASQLPGRGATDVNDAPALDWLQSFKQFFINVLYHILVASLTLMALF